jgi:hypothetical protein
LEADIIAEIESSLVEIDEKRDTIADLKARLYELLERQSFKVFYYPHVPDVISTTSSSNRVSTDKLDLVQSPTELRIRFTIERAVVT